MNEAQKKECSVLGAGGRYGFGRVREEKKRGRSMEISALQLGDGGRKGGRVHLKASISQGEQTGMNGRRPTKVNKTAKTRTRTGGASPGLVLNRKGPKKRRMKKKQQGATRGGKESDQKYKSAFENEKPDLKGVGNLETDRTHCLHRKTEIQSGQPNRRNDSLSQC